MALRYLSPIHKAYRQLFLYFEGPCAELGLIPHEGHLISYLAAYGPCPVSEIHRVLGIKRSTLSSMLGRLEERGLLKRFPHPDDRRSFQVQIQPAGTQLAKQMDELSHGLEAALEERLNDADRAGFEAVIAAIGALTQVQVRPEAKTPNSKSNP